MCIYAKLTLTLYREKLLKSLFVVGGNQKRWGTVIAVCLRRPARVIADGIGGEAQVLVCVAADGEGVRRGEVHQWGRADGEGGGLVGGRECGEGCGCG